MAHGARNGERASRDVSIIQGVSGPAMHTTTGSRFNATTRLALAACLTCLLLAGCEFFVGDEERVARAERALDAGDAGAAVVDLKNVLQKDPANSRARLLLARAELARGDVAAAAASFEKVDASAVDREQFEPLRWRLLWAQRKFEDVATGLKAPRPGLSEGERLLLLGRSLGGLGRSSEAHDALTQAAAAMPESGEALAALAVAKSAIGQSDDALALLQKAAGGPADDTHVQRALGELHFRAGRLPQAEQAFRRARDLADPARSPLDYLGASAGLGDVLIAGAKSDDAAQLAAELRKNAPGAGITLLFGARVAAAKGDTGAALENLQKLLNADPENGRIRTMLAGVQLEQGAVEQAAANLQRVLAADPGADDARRLLAQVQIVKGRPQEAEELLAAAPAATPDVALMRARAALAAGDTQRAVATLEGLAAEGIPTEEARLDLAAAFIQAGRADRALSLLEGGGADARREQLRIIATAAKDRPAAIRELNAYAARSAADPGKVAFAALSLSALGEHIAARDLLGKLSGARPDDPAVRVNLARVEARAGRMDAAEAALREAVRLRPEASTYVSLAQLAAARGREADSIRWLEQARKHDAKATAPRMLLARYYLARKDDAAALTIADELVALEPQRAQVRVVAALAAARAKNGARAEKEIDEAVRLAPDSAAVQIAKGEVHEQLGQLEQARAAFRRAASLEPGSQLPPTALARLELAAGNPDAALLAARRAQQTSGTRAIGLRLEGEILLREKRAAEAEKVFARLQSDFPSSAGAIAHYRARGAAGLESPEAPLAAWLERNPRDVAARLALAEHWQRGGQRPRAIAEYESALKLAPEDPVLLNNLAWLYHESGDARALETARRAYAGAPRNAAIADTLGVILVAANELDEGIRLLREAAAAAPGAADIQYHLAEALARKGSKAEAQAIVAAILRDGRAPAEARAKAEGLAKQLR